MILGGSLRRDAKVFVPQTWHRLWVLGRCSHAARTARLPVSYVELLIYIYFDMYLVSPLSHVTCTEKV